LQSQELYIFRYTQRIQLLEQQLHERGSAASDGASSVGASGVQGYSGYTPAPEAIAEDELVVIRHRLQGELNSIDGR
jgi:hypothetical protein